MQTECGYTPDQIREMTLFDVERLGKYWELHPPPGDLLRLLAQFVGWEPPKDKTKANDLGEFLKAVAGTGLSIDPRIFEEPQGNA